MTINELPKDYAVINWENLWRYVGRVVTGHHVPAMTRTMAAELRKSAGELRSTAEHLENTAKVLETELK